MSELLLINFVYGVFLKMCMIFSFVFLITFVGDYVYTLYKEHKRNIRDIHNIKSFINNNNFLKKTYLFINDQNKVNNVKDSCVNVKKECETNAKKEDETNVKKENETNVKKEDENVGEMEINYIDEKNNDIKLENTINNLLFRANDNDDNGIKYFL